MTTAAEERTPNVQSRTDDLSEIPGFNEAIAEYRTLVGKYRLDIDNAFATPSPDHDFVPQILPVVEQYEPQFKRWYQDLTNLVMEYHRAG